MKRLLGVRTAPPRVLDAERAGHFFSWFSLTPSGAPESADAGRAWQEFRPSNPVFARLVALAVLTDRAGCIVEASLGLDRTFLDGRQQSASARDIAKSFLYWALPEDEQAHVAAFLANVADLTAGGATVIMRGPRTPPPADRSGGYEVFLGRGGRITLRAGAVNIGLTNFDGALPAGGIQREGTLAPDGGPRWLRIDVRGLG
jgi:hypothetical protein